MKKPFSINIILILLSQHRTQKIIMRNKFCTSADNLIHKGMINISLCNIRFYLFLLKLDTLMSLVYEFTLYKIYMLLFKNYQMNYLDTTFFYNIENIQFFQHFTHSYYLLCAIISTLTCIPIFHSFHIFVLHYYIFFLLV